VLLFLLRIHIHIKETKHQKSKVRRRRASEGFDLSAIPCLDSGLGWVGLGLDRLVQGLDILLHVLALVLE
jgi:hypothetical protein